MFVSGIIPFSNKREKLEAWKQLKQEFNDNVKILIHDNFLTYTTRVPRSYTSQK